jgi:hypothetical protein
MSHPGWQRYAVMAAGACNLYGWVWPPDVLPYRAAMTTWCDVVGAANYVLR